MIRKGKLINNRLGIIVVGLSFVLWLSACNLQAGSNLFQDYSFEQAAELVLDTILQPDNIEDRPAIVFGLPHVLDAGDVIHPYNFFEEEPFPGLRVIEEETWFFWIDDAPGAYFAHPNRFVFISRASGEVSVVEEDWWPVLNGENLWPTDEDYWNPDHWIYSNISLEENSVGTTAPLTDSHLKLASLGRPQQERNSLQGLVINMYQEGERGEEDFAISSHQMEDRLRSSGFQTTYYGPASDTYANNSGSPTSSESERISRQPWVMWMDEHSSSMQPGDILVVYITGHGANIDGQGTIGGGQLPVTEKILAARLAKFNPSVNIIVMLESCHSGAFEGGLKDLADLTLMASAASGTGSASLGDVDYTLSWINPVLTDRNPNDKGGEFSSSIIEVWDQIDRDAARQQQIQQTAQQKGISYWEQFFSETFSEGLKYNFGNRLPIIGSSPLISIGSLKTKPTAVPTETPTATASVTPTATITPTQGPTATATLLSGVGTVKVANAFSRYGPGKAFLNEYEFKEGQKLRIVGRFFDWLFVQAEGFETTTWIASNLVETDLDINGLPFVNWDATMPFTEFAPKPTKITTTRNSDGTVTICWALSGIGGDDPRPALVVLNVTQDGQKKQIFMNDTNNCVTVKVDPKSESTARIYNGHQRGYSEGATVQLP